MQPDEITAIYAGPLRVNHKGVAPAALSDLTHLARVLLGRRGAASAGVATYSKSIVTESGVTIKVICAAGVYSAYITGAGVDGEASADNSDGGYPEPYSGVVTGAMLPGVVVPLSTNPLAEVPVLRRFSASAKILPRLQQLRDAKKTLITSLTESMKNSDDTALMKAALSDKLALTQFEYEHIFTDRNQHDVVYLAMKVPKLLGQYNNPRPSPPKQTPFSQFNLLKPTMFSGRMRYVVQWVMGYGKQAPVKVIRGGKKTEALPTTGYRVVPLDYPVRARDVVEAPHVVDDVELGALHYSPTWRATHGVYTSPAGRQYLIEISGAGVRAMRLPVIPMSGSTLKDEETRKKLKDIPLGYGFPTSKAKAEGVKSPLDVALSQGWVRVVAGSEVVAPFYGRLSAVYAECGWAFSESGGKADNVGYNYPLPRPRDYPVFEHWSITITGGDGDSEDDLYAYSHGEAGFDRDIATLEVQLSMVSKGSVWSLSRTYFPFRVPALDTDTGTPGVIGFDAMPRDFPRTPGTAIPEDYAKAFPTYPRCDTTVHVFYDGEALKKLRFYQPRTSDITESRSQWDERDYGLECMVLGSFSWGSSVEESGTPMGFYSTAADHRIAGTKSSVSMKSQGQKVWESPFMGIAYTFPYQPPHMGYESSDDYENDFNPEYNSSVGSPWTGKRHAFWVKVTGTAIYGEAHASCAALSMTDREFFAQYHRKLTERTVTYDYQYTALVMQFVYYTAPSWIPNGDQPGGVGVGLGKWLWWELRSDTVKYLKWRYWDDEHNYTKEKLEKVSAIIPQVAGKHTAPMSDYDRTKTKTGVITAEVVVTASGGAYDGKMKPTGDNGGWYRRVPSGDGSEKTVPFWCTRSVLGAAGEKIAVDLGTMMRYTGFNNDVLDEGSKIAPNTTVTFLGEP